MKVLIMIDLINHPIWFNYKGVANNIIYLYIRSGLKYLHCVSTFYLYKRNFNFYIEIL